MSGESGSRPQVEVSEGQDRVSMSGPRRALAAARRRVPLHREDGQAVFEFAIVATVLLLILFGIIEFGRAWNNKNDVVHLANAAARMAVVGTVDCAALSEEAKADGLPAVGSGGTQINWWPTGDPATSPDARVDATASAPFTSLVPALIPGLPSTLSGRATMHAERAIPAGSCP